MRSETADEYLPQLGDVLLHPVPAEVRLLDQRLQIRDEPHVAGRARRLHRLREPAFGLDRGPAPAADERQRAGQQVFSRREHEILIADAKCDDALRFRIDADVERRAGGLARLEGAARPPQGVLHRSCRRQPRHVQELELADVVQRERRLGAGHGGHERHVGRHAGGRRELAVRALEAQEQPRP